MFMGVRVWPVTGVLSAVEGKNLFRSCGSTVALLANRESFHSLTDSGMRFPAVLWGVGGEEGRPGSDDAWLLPREWTDPVSVTLVSFSVAVVVVSVIIGSGGFFLFFLFSVSCGTRCSSFSMYLGGLHRINNNKHR